MQAQLAAAGCGGLCGQAEQQTAQHQQLAQCGQKS
jgi:hypothetical protein